MAQRIPRNQRTWVAETAANPTIACGYCLVLLVLPLAPSFPVASQAGYAQIPRPAPVGSAVPVGKPLAFAERLTPGWGG